MNRRLTGNVGFAFGLCLIAVVRSEDEDRIVANTKLVDRSIQSADILINLVKQVCPRSIARHTSELRMRHRGVVGRRVRQIEEERLVRRSPAAHVIDGFVGQVAIDLGTVIKIVLTHHGRGHTFAPLKNFRRL